MSSNRREFIAGTGAAIATLAGLGACARRATETAAAVTNGSPHAPR